MEGTSIAKCVKSTTEWYGFLSHFNREKINFKLTIKWISKQLNFEVHYNKYLLTTSLKSKGKKVFIICTVFCIIEVVRRMYRSFE